MEWRPAATGDDFEHDVSVGNAAAIVLLVVVLALGTILIVWTPDDVVVPLWVVMLVLICILFFPTRWALRRPWRIVAEVQNEDGTVERWVGTVRGVFNVRQQSNRVIKSIARDGVPGVEGPLQPVA
jgi:hypothetical protein